jgi:hypothetical protein
MDDVIVTRPMLGLCHMEACVKKGLDDETILREVNKLNPCATTQRWCRIERDEESLRPVQCEQEADREHLIVCRFPYSMS